MKKEVIIEMSDGKRIPLPVSSAKPILYFGENGPEFVGADDERVAPMVGDWEDVEVTGEGILGFDENGDPFVVTEIGGGEL